VRSDLRPFFRWMWLLVLNAVAGGDLYGIHYDIGWTCLGTPGSSH
jgi:hypothetical protein